VLGPKAARSRRVHVIAPDLPSHQSAAAGLSADAASVRHAIHSCPQPVVLAGWSYGGVVISMAAAGEHASVCHLVYVSDIPHLPESEQGDLSWIDEDPHISFVDGGAFVLDNDWLLNEEAGTTMPDEVHAHLLSHPRRPAARAVFEPQAAAAWESIPVTVLIGDHDELVSDAERSWVAEHFDDVRVLPTDHFLIFRDPDAVSQAVFEAFDRAKRG